MKLLQVIFMMVMEVSIIIPQNFIVHYFLHFKKYVVKQISLKDMSKW